MILEPDAPLHVREGKYSAWRSWFAWYPVVTEQRTWVWGRRTWRRTFFPPLWFIPPAPCALPEFSDVKRGFWEVETP